jgi:hypothetical protein
LPRASQAVRQNQNRSPLPQASPGADRRCIHKALRVTAILLTPLPIALAEPGGPPHVHCPQRRSIPGRLACRPPGDRRGFPSRHIFR